LMGLLQVFRGLENKYLAVSQRQTAIKSGLWECSAQVTGIYKIKLITPVRNGTTYCTHIILGWHYLMPVFQGLISILTMWVACAYETLVSTYDYKLSQLRIPYYESLPPWKYQLSWTNTGQKQFDITVLKTKVNHIDLLVFRNDKVWI
jgi:hypothetical protein